MAPVNITLAGYLAFAVVLPATFAQSSGPVPDCLNQCLSETTEPCTSASLPLLISCINANCPSSQDSSDNSTTSDTVASSIHLTYTPKKQYSCQQSFLPGSSEDAPSMQLTGDGTCMTSPYDFQSLFVTSSAAEAEESEGADGESSSAGMTLQKVARQCTMSLFAGEECEGEPTELDLSEVQGDKCVFQSGRSARLVCSALRAPDTPSYASILSSLCTGANASGAQSGANSTSVAANSSTTISTTPYSTGTGAGRVNGSTSATSTTPQLPTVSTQPYTGRASGDQVAKPSLIALVALFAVAVLVL